MNWLPRDISPATGVSLGTAWHRMDGNPAAKGKLWARVVTVEGDRVILAVADQRLAAKTMVPLAEGDLVSLSLGPMTGGQIPLRVTGRIAGGVSPESAVLPQVILRLPAGVRVPDPGEVVLGRVVEAQGRAGVLRLLGADLPAVSDVTLETGGVLPLLWEGSGSERAVLRILPQGEKPPPAPLPLETALERAGWPSSEESLALARALRVAGLPVNGPELVWLGRVAAAVASSPAAAPPEDVPGPRAAPPSGEAPPEGEALGASWPPGGAQFLIIGKETTILAAARLHAENPLLSPETLGMVARLAPAEDLGQRLAQVFPKEELFYRPGNGEGAGGLSRVIDALYGSGAGILLDRAGPAGRELGTTLLYHHLLSAGGSVWVGVPVVWGKEPGMLQIRVEKEAVTRKVNSRRTVVRLSLEAPHLGTVSIAMEFNDQQLNVKFVAQEEGSRGILAAGAATLQKNLEKLAFSVGSLHFTTASTEAAEEDQRLDQRV
jgi:hypothetical protein